MILDNGAGKRKTSRRLRSQLEDSTGTVVLTDVSVGKYLVLNRVFLLRLKAVKTTLDTLWVLLIYLLLEIWVLQERFLPCSSRIFKRKTLNDITA